METIQKFETVTLSNEKEYLVFDIVEKNNKRYLYLVDEINNEVLLVNDVNGNLEIITNEEELKQIAEEILTKIGE